MEKMLTLGVVLSATDMLSPVFNKAGKNLGKFEGKIKALGASMTKLGTVSLGLGTALAAPLGAAFSSYQDIAAAQGEIASLDISDSGIKAITKASMEFSNQFAGTTASDFIKASYDIKSGIETLSNTAVGEFTKIAAMTGAATKSSTSEMTSLFASGYGIYRKQFSEFGATTIEGWKNLSQEEQDVKFGQYFSAGIAGTVKAFKTTGANMSAAISSLGAAGTSAGIGFAEQLSVLGQLQKTMSGSEAATKYRAFLSSAVGASDKLGLSFTDVNNKLLSMPEILKELKSKYGDTIDAMEAQELKKAFGTEEAVGMIKLLYGETDTLTTNIEGMNKKLQNGTKQTKEMALALNKGKEFELLGQKMGNLSAMIGQAFAPMILDTVDVLGSVISSMQTWTSKNQGLTKAITMVLAGGAALLTVFGTIAISVGAITMAIPALTTAFGLLTGGIGILGTVMGTVGRIFLMNPIGFVISVIAGAAYAIYSNWEPIFNWLSDKFEWLSEAASGIAEFFGLSDDKDKSGGSKTLTKKTMDISQTSLNYATPKINSPASQAQQTVIHKNQTVTQHIKVNVTNPSSNVEVETAIRNAMINDSSDRSLSDDM